VEGAAHDLEAEDLTILRRAAGDLLVKEAGGRFVALDPVVTDALRREGLARELVSRVQRMRKEAGLAVSDRIHLWIWGAGEIEEAILEYIGWMSGEVLATHLRVGAEHAPADVATQSLELDGLEARVALIVDE
jgi:isoleucyl-tRNA synthetase